MSGFKALNIESDDESDVEIDDTKEIQIEEALKLYQSALKYHAGGPSTFDQAATAYRQLFESEIFHYPESQTELQRIELYGPAPEYDDPSADFAGEAVVTTGSLENGPSTLPQILHLSHKNYARFRLEALAASFDTFNVTLRQILSDATAALVHFVEALDKDDTDLDLWRKTASVGELLDSKRIARFCLEAVIDGDDEGLAGVLSLPGLEDSMAGEQLRELVRGLKDHLSVLQAPLSVTKRKALSKMLRQKLDPYGGLLAREKALKQTELSSDQKIPQPQRLALRAPENWTELGDILYQQHLSEQHSSMLAAPAAAIGFVVEESNQKLYPSAILDTRRGVEDPQPALAMQMHMPNDISEQFPGLDSGKPTVQPQIQEADANMQLVSRPVEGGEAEMSESPAVSLPTRKRSNETAGLVDGAEEGRIKSKRLRARESIPESAESRQAMIDANTLWEFEQQIAEVQAADDWMYDTIGQFLERIGINGFKTGKHVRHQLENGAAQVDGTLNAVGDDSKHDLRQARANMSSFLHGYSDQLAKLLLTGGDNLDLDQSSTVPGFDSAFSDSWTSKQLIRLDPMPDDGLEDLITEVNSSWLLTKQVAYKFIQGVLRPGQISSRSSYTSYMWPEAFKTAVVRVLVNYDETIFESACTELGAVSKGKSHANSSFPILDFAEHLCEMIQIIFELHLDIFCLIKDSNSGVDGDTITLQSDRLLRWSELAREGAQLRVTFSGTPNLQDELNLRFLWATTFNISVSADTPQDHVLDCMRDLRALLVEAGEPTISLRNNAIIPEISVAALDRQISRLTTSDFFAKITEQDQKDPVAVIESLEPLLDVVEATPSNSEEDEQSPTRLPDSLSPDLVHFLQDSPLSVRLLLWRRLRDAYGAINYDPMVARCYMRMIRAVMKELKSEDFLELPQAERQVVLLKSLSMVQGMTNKLLVIFQECSAATECIDARTLKDAFNSFGQILHLLQVFNVFEDYIRIGQAQPPMLSNGLPIASFAAVSTMIHELQLHIWMIMYSLFKETISQHNELYPTPLEDRFDFLRVVHRNLGIRCICGGSNRIFVKMLKDEFFQMTHVETYDSEQAQVLYDLYGLNCFRDPSYELIEHRCTHDAFLDRGVAMQAVDLLMSQAEKMPIRDLIKHPLKDTIDKVHGSLLRKKPTEAILRNREICRTFLRSPINPLDLYKCLKGEGNQLPVLPIPDADSRLASKGWYFLMGHMSLTKFRSQKRTGPTPTEEVDIAIAFFNQELEYSIDNWETWFRLAQAYDTKIEEMVVWTAERLNSNMPDVVQLQRAAIHCFTMATALAYRSAPLAFGTSEKMTELYSDFAMRIYSSSRAPFSMLPFALDDAEKFLSLNTGMAKGKPFQPLTEYTAWKLAKNLFQRAIGGNGKSWTLHYMLGKCLWKMYAASHASRRNGYRPSAQEVLDSIIRAIELVPSKKDNRDAKREPVIEPHYKLVSIVHKMVLRKDMDLVNARETLSHSHYARLGSFPSEMREWFGHVLAVLKNLRSADKSHWHHRMIIKSARIIDEIDTGNEDQPTLGTTDIGAEGAKAELTQQMFTKTMVLQVWRPDAERPGRHFVYTTAYTRYFVGLLEELNDRASLEQLARRVRRRPNDFFEHHTLWHDICKAYLQLLREHGRLKDGLETATFSGIAHEDFLARKEVLEKWMQVQDIGASPALDVLREVQELKKINQSLTKPGPIDDLIGDSYAHLFATVGRELFDEQRKVKEDEEARRPPPAMSPPKNPAMSLSHLMNLDGTNESPAAAAPASAAAATTQADAIAPRKKVGVGRREIRNAAEACQKTSAPGSASSSKLNIPTDVRVSVVIQRNSNDFMGDTIMETSAPGSLHDSADDESELSELEEEDEEEREDESKRPLFPGLARDAEVKGGSLRSESGEEGDEDGSAISGDVEMREDGEGEKSPEEHDVETARGPGNELNE